jgi:predicted phosphodiesterase
MSRTSWRWELSAVGLLACMFAFTGCSSGADERERVVEVGAQGTSEVGQAVTAPEQGLLAAAGTVPTDPNLKIAFVGDTADGNNWKSVLTLVQNEGAAAVMVAGDMTYDADPAGWWTATESKVGQTWPVFLARGNHDDSSWSGFLGEAANHLGGATRTNGPHNAAYKTVYRGLTLINIKKGDTATTINNLVGSDNHIWKVCGWHQNQNKMQVGGKGDEMGWGVYEACRQQGAIIITGHEHTYHRTKTMTSTTNQTIDSSCATGNHLCVGPNRTFVTVVGTGGTGLRSQVRCTPTSSTAPFPSLNTSDPSCPIWASIYTTNQGAKFGALFITFNVDGNQKKAHAYFKNISGTTIDTYDIFAD